MQGTGSSLVQTVERTTLRTRLQDLLDRHRLQTAATLAVLAFLTFIAAEVFPAVQEFVTRRDVVQYVVLLVLLDLAVSIQLQQRPPLARLFSNQDESMSKLLEAVDKCRIDGADLLEYAGATTLPLIRAIRREGVPMRMLIKHPDTIEGLQRQRTITTLETIYNSIFEEYQGKFEIRCYRLPFGLRGRRLGKELLEVGWLTPDVKRQTAYGHANPSVIADLSTRSNEYLRTFFERTFNDLWNHGSTEEGRAVLEKMGSPASGSAS